MSAPNRQSLWLAAGLVLVAANLRMAVTCVGPILGEVMRTTGLSGAGASLLTTVPSLCFGLFGPAGPLLARRLGVARAVLAALLVATAGMTLRGLDGIAALFCGQIVACGGIAVMNVLLPGVVKRDFPHQVALITGLYTTAMSLGAATAAGAVVPLARAFGGSPAAALVFWAAPALLAAGIWAAVAGGDRGGETHARVPARGLWRDFLAWQVSLFMGLQAMLAYIVFAWLALWMRARGMSAVGAGLVLSVSVLAQAGGNLIAPIVARLFDQRLGNAGSIVVSILGLLGCAWAPLWQVWLWAMVLGISQGVTFPLALMMLAFRAGDSRTAGQLSSMAQTVGYLLASAGPLLTGLLHAASGSWDAVAVFCAGIGGLGALSGFAAGRDRLVRLAPARGG